MWSGWIEPGRADSSRAFGTAGSTAVLELTAPTRDKIRPFGSNMYQLLLSQMAQTLQCCRFHQSTIPQMALTWISRKITQNHFSNTSLWDSRLPPDTSHRRRQKHLCFVQFNRFHYQWQPSAQAFSGHSSKCHFIMYVLCPVVSRLAFT